MLEREVKDNVSLETRHFISSLNANDPRRLGAIVRAHWGIENYLHWDLDNAFAEDAQRQRKGYSAANMAIVRHIASNLLKAETSTKVGIKTKCLNAAWDERYLITTLRG